MWTLKYFFDFKKEEKWLEDKTKQGYRLRVANSGYYRFDFVNSPGEYTIKVDYRTFYKDKDYHNYCAMFEDSGWQHIAGSKWSGTQYFAKVRPDAGDDIFSDNFSRAGRYKKFSSMWLSLALGYFPIVFIFMSNGNFSFNNFLNWKTLYLTPGLWDLTGSQFWFAFLFETPFAFMRGFGWSLFLLIVIGYLYCGLKSYLLYQRELKKV